VRSFSWSVGRSSPSITCDLVSHDPSEPGAVSLCAGELTRPRTPGCRARDLKACAPHDTVTWSRARHDCPMAQRGSARASREALEGPWHVAIEMAWQSYRDGGIAVGAVLADGAGVVVSEGRNQRFAGRTRSLQTCLAPPHRHWKTPGTSSLTAPGNRPPILVPGRDWRGVEHHRGTAVTRCERRPPGRLRQL
jgi:hypothetical protein